MKPQPRQETTDMRGAHNSKGTDWASQRWLLMDDRRIAAVTGTNLATVQYHRRRLGFPPFGRPKETRTCACGNVFQVWIRAKRRTCTWKCVSATHSKKCRCGAPFTTRVSNKEFCTVECNRRWLRYVSAYGELASEYMALHALWLRILHAESAGINSPTNEGVSSENQ